MPRAPSSKRARSGTAAASAPTFDTSGSAQFAFAPNVTPVSFNDPKPSLGPVSESSLFPSCDLPPRKVTHSRKKPDDHIPRPPNAFILFRSSFVKSDHVSTAVESNHSTLSKIIGYTWSMLPPAEKQIWFDKAKAILEEHKAKYPGYSFRPDAKTQTPYPTKKRKVREVGPKDTKRCEKIAELLLKGKKGAELDQAVNEFDRSHVPQVVTRFDAPVTARHFRRSSSAPADERPSSPFLASVPPANKLRAVSSQPEHSSPVYASSMPSTPSQYIPPLVSEYESTCSEYSAPSSPFAEVCGYPTPAPNPDMGFDSFSFNTCAPPSSTESCDPLSSPYAGQLPIFAPQPHSACYMPQPALHPSSGLRIDTNVAGMWASGPSSTPLSSSPNTPSPYPSEYMETFQPQSTYYDGEMTQPVDELQGLPIEAFQSNCGQQWVQPEYYYGPTYTAPDQAVLAEQVPVYQKYADVSDAAYPPPMHSYVTAAHPYPIHSL